MALFNYANREITAKVVYYGPGVCGKTTSLQYIHERIAPVQRGRLLSLATETDRTIFFDLLPLKLGEIRGFKLRFQLYTVPGQVKYNKTRKLVLQGADAIVFVADSQVNRREKNIESFRNLQDNLKEQGKNLNDLPLVFAYNKRDLDNILSIEQLNQDLNPKNLPYFPAVATKGVGVMETLEAISKNALQDIEHRLSASTKAEAPEAEAEFSLTDDDLLDLTGDEASLGDEATSGDEATLDTGSLSLSDDLDTLELDSDLDLGTGEETLESKPIGYDNTIQVEEFEIQTDTVAHTGTLKESEFFDLKDIEEQALRELDEFIDGNLDDSDFDSDGDFRTGNDLDTGDSPLSFDSFGSDVGDAGTEDTGNDLFGSSASDDSTSGFSFADSGSADENADDDLDFSFSAASLDRDSESEPGDDGLDFSFSASPLGEETEEAQDGDSGLEFSFGAAPSGQDSESEDDGLDFSFSAADGTSASEAETAEEEIDFGASLEPDSLLDFTLGDEPGAETAQPQQSNTDSDLEPLELSEDDLDFSDLDQESVDSGDDLDLSFGDNDNVTADAEGDFPSFTLTEDDGGDGEEPASPAADEDDLVEFSLDEALDASPEPSTREESTANSNIESLNLSDEDLDLSFGNEDEENGTSSLSGLNIPDEESGPPYDFRITDSVRFEMQHSEEISSVTPFEKQLDELSGEMFTAEQEPSRDDFEPETVEDSGDEQFQALTDETKRQLVIAKYFYQQGEIARAKQQTRSHIQAIMMYSLAVETVLKAVVLKYETCNPSVASLKIILDSIEEETGNTISGRKSVMDNILTLKDEIQMETSYPDQDACELAARICDRFLSTLAEEFLSIDINDLSPILPEPVET
jgi:signal recognition particle receptor subunit beta